MEERNWCRYNDRLDCWCLSIEKIKEKIVDCNLASSRWNVRYGMGEWRRNTEKKKGWKIPLRAVVFRLRRRFDIYACIEKKERIGEMRKEEREKEKRKNKEEEREKEAHAIEGLYSLESARTLLIRSRTVNWILYEDNEVDDTQYISGPTAIFCRAGGRFYKKGFRSPI